MGFSCVICITTDTIGTERKKTGIMRYPKGLMLRKKRPAKRYQRRGPGEGGRFHAFFHFLLHEAGFTADLDGSCEVGRGPTETLIRSCPYLFCVGIVSLSECPSRRRTHTTTGRRDGTARTGGVETKKEGTTQILPTFATYLPTYLPGISNLSSYLCRHSY